MRRRPATAPADPLQTNAAPSPGIDPQLTQLAGMRAQAQAQATGDRHQHQGGPTPAPQPAGINPQISQLAQLRNQPAFGSVNPNATGTFASSGGAGVGNTVGSVANAPSRQQSIDAAKAQSAGQLAANGGTFNPTPADPRQQAIDQAKQQSQDALAANGGAGPGDGYGAQLNELQAIRNQQKDAMDAERKQLAADKASALEEVAARMGLGGFGLSGASGAALSDTSIAQDRAGEQDLSKLAAQQRLEQLNAIQAQASIDDEELATNTDYDGDGKVAGNKGPGWNTGSADDEPGDAASKDDKKNADLTKDANKIVNGLGGTGANDDPLGGIGGFGQDGEKILSQLVAKGMSFDHVQAEIGAFNHETYVVARGSDGRWYKFHLSTLDNWTDPPSEDDVLNLFTADTTGGGG